MSGRNRAEGWKHAKLTGHDNERLAAELTKSDPEVQKRLLECAHLKNVEITDVQYGGICEADVDCVLGGKTKSKTDMWLLLSNGKRLNVSIKKDKKGQVFLIGISRFIEGFEKQYGKKIDNRVQRALELYFGSADDIVDIINANSGRNKALELRKHRLVAETLKAYDESLYDDMLTWINANISDIFDFCFSRGLAKEKSDWADIVWYINLIGENHLDKMIYLPELGERIPEKASYGVRNGGSTVQLPFGFVQWHCPSKVPPGKLQFHHDFIKMCDLTDK